MRFQQIKPKDDRFKPGDRVKMKYYKDVIGDVTMVREEDCKVLWDGDPDLEYSYYLKSELELVRDEEQK